MNFNIAIAYIFSALLVISCSSQKKMEDNNLPRTGSMEPLSLPVGVVELTYLVKEVTERGNKIFCYGEVIEVHGYGNSVKAISEKMNYKFEIDTVLFKSLSFDQVIGKNIRCRLIKLPGSMDTTGPDNLKIVSIKNL